MLNKLKDFRLIILLSIVCISLCILTFLAFVNPKILSFAKINLQIILIFDVILFVIFLFIIFIKSSELYLENKKKKIRFSN